MEEKKFLTADDIRSVPDLSEKDFFVKAWDGWVHLRELTAGDRDWVDGSMIAEVQNGEAQNIGTNKLGQKVSLDLFRVKVCLAGIIDPLTKERLFTNEQLLDLASKNSDAINDIAYELMSLSKITEAQVKALGEDLERIRGEHSDSGSLENSVAPSENSTSDSQAVS
jgi:hypothetical protein